eukprot:scaffold3164_cov237-Pinguiococcus_pyrenoidosus.AAC.3
MLCALVLAAFARIAHCMRVAAADAILHSRQASNQLRPENAWPAVVVPSGLPYQFSMATFSRLPQSLIKAASEMHPGAKGFR